MAIEEEIVVELVRVEVGNDYRVELTVHDLHFGIESTACLTWSQAEQLVEELRSALADAGSALAEDRPEMAVHGFDVDVTPEADPIPAVCKDCSEGKHGACIGSAYIEVLEEICEVDCGCTAVGHRGRS